MKTCTKCKREKSEAEFYKRGSGFRSECKSCDKERSIDWAKKNPEKHSAWKLAWDKAHPEKKWHKTNPEKSKAAMRKHYGENKEHHLKASRLYRKTMKGWATGVLSSMKSNCISRGHAPPCFESRDQLLGWAKAQPSFFSIWDAWVFASYSKLLRPSVDRLNNEAGYEWGNMRLITWKDNHDAWTSSERHKENFKNAQKNNPAHIKHRLNNS